MLDDLVNFSDVVIFDATFKRNLYHLPLAFTVVVDSMGKSKLAKAVLLPVKQETIEEFSWFFQQFKRVSGNATTIRTIFTDGDAAFISAIVSRAVFFFN